MNKLLMIDDSDVNLAIYRGALYSLPDTEVSMEMSPRVALGRAVLETFDVIIVDFHMPEMDGLEFISEFRRIEGSKETIVVMITSETDVAIRRKALEMGVTDFLNKPVDRSELQARIRNLLSLASAQRQLASRAVQLRHEVDLATETIRKREVETIMRLTRAAEFRDAGTGMHVVRVGEMAAALARSMGLPSAECEMILLAAPMHDVGKVATPDEILLKPGKLTVAEFEVMKQHAQAGYEILRESESPMLQLAAEIAISHHERFDGKGYPNHLAGHDIPLSGRLVSIVDVFDALTSVRPYKPAWTSDAAIAEIRKGNGTQFDPEIHELFFGALDEILDIRRRFQDNVAVA
jgi:putative nucleotidyltransferase with HDIG domain